MGARFCREEPAVDDMTLDNTSPHIPISAHSCKVLRVIDGDTIEVAFWHHGFRVRERLRMLGVDACELHSKQDDRHLKDQEELKARVQKSILANAVEGRVVTLVVTGERDNFGRLLGTVCDDEHGSLSDYMVRMGCRPR